jgi:hypothetical protein
MPSYRERRWAPVSWLLIALAGALLLALSFSADGGALAVVLYGVVPVLSVLAVVALSRDELRVQDGVLHVPGARAPLTAFGPAEVLDRTQLRERMGIRAQRDAWIRVKPWLRQGVLLPVCDPEDETPYWLIGTRKPVDLAVAVALFPEPFPQPPT